MHEIFGNEKLLKGPTEMSGKLGKGKSKNFSVTFIPEESVSVKDEHYDCLINEDGSILQILLDSGALIDGRVDSPPSVEEASDAIKEAEKALLKAEDAMAAARPDEQKSVMKKVKDAQKVLTAAKKEAKKAAK